MNNLNQILNIFNAVKPITSKRVVVEFTVQNWFVSAGVNYSYTFEYDTLINPINYLINAKETALKSIGETTTGIFLSLSVKDNGILVYNSKRTIFGKF